LSDYNINLDVREGTLAPFKDVNVRSNFRLFRKISVAEGARLDLPQGGTMSIWELSGAGLVTNAGNSSVKMSVLSSYGERSRFGGEIGGPVNLTVSGGLYLEGTNNFFNGTVLVSNYKGNPAGYAGFLAVRSFGSDVRPGSLGSTDYYAIGINGAANANAGSAYI
jgi:hypothetical protein